VSLGGNIPTSFQLREDQAARLERLRLLRITPLLRTIRMRS